MDRPMTSQEASTALYGVPMREHPLQPTDKGGLATLAFMVIFVAGLLWSCFAHAAPFSIDTYTGTGAQTSFSVTFPYITQPDVFVTVNGVAQANGTAYTYTSSNVIRFAVAPANGASVVIQRLTNLNTNDVVFSGGAISSQSLNQANTQHLYHAQEAYDRASLTPPAPPLSNDLRVINVADLLPPGTPLDGSVDVSQGVLAAFAAVPASGGVVYFPPGVYKYCPISPTTINITTPNTTIWGSGWASLIEPCQTSGDFLHVYPAAGPNIQGLTVHNLSVYATGANPTGGALLHLDRTNGFKVEGSAFQGYYGGIQCDGCVHGFITTTDLQSDANFTADATGSYLFDAIQNATTGAYPAEVHITHSDWRGQSGNNHLNYAVLIAAADGIFFDEPHLGFAKVCLDLQPSTNATQLTSVVISKGYLDTCSQLGLEVQQPSSSYAATFGLNDLDFSVIFNSGGDGVFWNLSTSGSALPNRLSAAAVMNNIGNGINLAKAQNVNLPQGFGLTGNSFGTAGFYGLVLGANATNVFVGAGVIEQGQSSTTPSYCVGVANGATNFTIDRIRCRNSAIATISDSSTTANKSVVTPIAY